ESYQALLQMKQSNWLKAVGVNFAPPDRPPGRRERDRVKTVHASSRSKFFIPRSIQDACSRRDSTPDQEGQSCHLFRYVGGPSLGRWLSVLSTSQKGLPAGQ
ncbi:unnamed protein product, partial [Durusdinium trenchii]